MAEDNKTQSSNALLPNTFKLAPSTNAPAIALQVLNAPLPMIFTLSNLGTLAILMQPSNALSESCTMLLGNVRLVMPVQPMKHSNATVVYVGVLGKTSEVNAEQPRNAEFPMDAIADCVDCCRLSAPAKLQFRNALAPI